MSREDLDREDAEALFQGALGEFVANILRVTRGAGRPESILPEAADLVRVAEAYRHVVGHWPDSYLIQQALNWDKRFYSEPPEERRMREYATDTAIRGALQIVASRLLSQPTQEAAGDKEFADGLHGIEKAREAEREAWAKSRPKGFTEMLAAKAAAQAVAKKRRPKGA